VKFTAWDLPFDAVSREALATHLRDIGAKILDIDDMNRTAELFVPPDTGWHDAMLLALLLGAGSYNVNAAGHLVCWWD